MDSPFNQDPLDGPGNNILYGFNQGNNDGQCFDSSNSVSPTNSGCNNSSAGLLGSSSDAFDPLDFGQDYAQHDELFGINAQDYRDDFYNFMGAGNEYFNFPNSSPRVGSMLQPSTPFQQHASHNTHGHGYDQKLNYNTNDFFAIGSSSFDLNSPGSRTAQVAQTHSTSKPTQYPNLFSDSEYASAVAPGSHDDRNESSKVSNRNPNLGQIQGAVPSMHASQSCSSDNPFQTPKGPRISPKRRNTMSTGANDLGNWSEEEDDTDGDEDYVDEEDSSPRSVELKQKANHKDNASAISGSEQADIEAEVDNIGASGDAEADYLRVKMMMRKQEHRDDRDNSFPGDPRKQLRYVLKLVRAFFNIENVNDKKSLKGELAQAVIRFKNRYYSELEVKLTCWELFFKCRDAQSGIKLVPQYHKSKTEDFQTFDARWQAIIHACMYNKALCKQVMDPSYMDRVVEAPAFEAKMKDNNRKINAERDKQNSLGRNAIKKGLDMSYINSIDADKFKSEEGTPSRKSNGPKKTPNKRTPVNNAFDTPKSCGTTNTFKSSTDKRKHSALQVYDLEGDDLDSQETPTKRGPGYKSGQNSRVSTVTNTATTTSRHYHEKIMSDSPSKKPQDMLSGPKDNENENHGVPVVSGTATNSEAENLESHFKRIIYNILEVDPNKCGSLTLHQLRVYARPYNRETRDDEWTHPSAPGYIWKGFSGTNPNLGDGNNIVDVPHFALTLPEFKAIAQARGDLDGNSSLYPAEANYFNTGGIKTVNCALGLIPNPFGPLRYNSA